MEYQQVAKSGCHTNHATYVLLQPRHLSSISSLRTSPAIFSQKVLEDITITANNSASRPSVSKPQTDHSPSESGPISGTSKPHYMMPTSTSRDHHHLSRHDRCKPLTPVSLDSGIPKRKNWVSSASKRLGLSNPKIRMPANKQSGFDKLSASPGPGLKSPQIPSYIPVKRGPSVPAALSSPIPRKRQTPEKPLPSLPVATVTTGSPIHRRSLIDATERPLRRSLSPRFGHDEVADWPALSPERPLSGICVLPKQAPIKPSLGESVLEGLRHLDIRDDAPRPQAIPYTSIDQRRLSGETVLEPIVQGNGNLPSGRASHEASSNHPTSDDSIIERAEKLSISSPRLAPVVRQTKNSYMRARLSSGSIDGLTYNLNQVKPSIASRNDSDERKTPARSTGRKDSQSTRLNRLNSHSRHTATPRGSPYLVHSRSKPQLVDIKRKPVASQGVKPTKTSPRPSSSDSTEDSRPSKVIAVRTKLPSESKQRQASVRSSSRSVQQDLAADVEAKTQQFSFHDHQVWREGPDCHNSDSDTDAQPKPRYQSPTVVSREAETTEKSNLLSFSEIMTSPAPAADELDNGNNSDEGSVHGYDQEGGFKIKKLRGPYKHGATLRIADDAHRLLSPDSKFENEKSVNENKRSSITDLRQAVVLKEHFRRSSDRIMSQVQLTRSKTLARLSGTDSQDGDMASVSEYSVPENGGISDPEPSPVELPAESMEEQTVQAMLNLDETPMDAKFNGTPSSAGRGSWPLKEFSAFSSATKSTPAMTDASTSPWIPPPDWDTALDQGDVSAVSEGTATPCPAVPQNTPATEAKVEPNQVRVSSRPSDSRDRIPTPTPSRFSDKPARRMSVDPVKKPSFPARTSSKITRQPTYIAPAPYGLSPVEESPDKITGLRQIRKPYGDNLKPLAAPRHVKSFSESIEDIHQSFEAVRPSARAVPPATSGKKAISTLKGLFHKKSLEFRGSSRRVDKQVSNIDEKSSPLLATPTPFPNSLRKIKGLSPLASDIVSARTDKTTPKPVTKGKPSAFVEDLESATPQSKEISDATESCMRLLDMARSERNTKRQAVLVDLGTLTVNLITAAREAAKQSERAKAAAIRAEMMALECGKDLALLERLVSEFVGSLR